jgi:hypothetical protein
MEDIVGETVARQRFSAVLLAAFSGLSLLVACVGICIACRSRDSSPRKLRRSDAPLSRPGSLRYQAI